MRCKISVHGFAQRSPLHNDLCFTGDTQEPSDSFLPVDALFSIAPAQLTARRASAAVHRQRLIL
jgi:hypothetical protein